MINEEQEIKNLWNAVNVTPLKMELGALSKLPDISRAKSKNIIQEIIDNSKKESAYGVLIALSLTFYYEVNMTIVWLMIAGIIVSLSISIRSFFVLRRGMFTINQQNTKSAIKSYIRLISDYQAKLNYTIRIYLYTLFFTSSTIISVVVFEDTQWHEFIMKLLFVYSLGVVCIFSFLRFVFQPYCKSRYAEPLADLIQIYEELKSVGTDY